MWRWHPVSSSSDRSGTSGWRSGLGDGAAEGLQRDRLGLGPTALAGVQRVDRGDLVRGQLDVAEAEPGRVTPLFRVNVFMG